MWVLQAVRMGSDESHTDRTDNSTLYNPHKLESTLSRFAASQTHVQVGAFFGRKSAPKEARHRTESLCRSLLEKMLEMKLTKCRPKWLLNPTTKRCLELDMYNEEHKLAFEYDGAQHDVYTPHYHTNEAHFEYRRLLDKLKNELCREAGVLLIRIPWTEVSTKDKVRTRRALFHDKSFVHGSVFGAPPVHQWCSIPIGQE